VGSYKSTNKNRRNKELTNEDAFNAAKNAFSMFGAFFNNVAQEIGLEQALNLNTKTCEMMGVHMGQMTKEQMGIKELDAKTAAMAARSVVSGFGLSNVDAEERSTSVLFNVHECPVYEGYHAAGIDDDTKEAMCRKGAVIFMDTLFKQLDPNASYHLKRYRSAPDDYCEEEITLRK
jgi:hypothetical protein